MRPEQAEPALRALLAEAARRVPGFRRFVHVSTVGVHGHIEAPPADEICRFSPGDAYQRTKAEAELWLREFAPRNALPFTVIRPAPATAVVDTPLGGMRKSDVLVTEPVGVVTVIRPDVV